MTVPDSPDPAVADIGRDFRPTPRPSVASVELDGEGVLFDEVTYKVHLLNPVATVIWSCFDGEVTIGELAVELSEAYGIDEATAEHDIVELARELGGEGLLEGVGPPPQPEEPPASVFDSAPTAGVTDDDRRLLIDPPSS